MTEIRCKKCKRLLMKASVVICELKCPKCGHIQKIGEYDESVHDELGLKTVSYMIPLKLSGTGADPDDYAKRSDAHFQVATISVSI